jgi:pheromone shutdown-related protein TraB
LVQHRVGDRLLLVGTAHVSPESVREVETAIAEFQPDVVAVELDANRLSALEDKTRWENTPFHKILKGGKLWLFLTQVLLASYQRRMGEIHGAEPGAEMLAAVQAARAQNRDVLLADRDVGLTMKRAYGTMGFREKWRLIWEIFRSFFATGDEKEAQETDLQKLTQEDAVTSMMNELGQIAPSIKTVVIDERDQYLATKIQAPLNEGKRVVAGHLPGIRRRFEDQAPPADLAALETLPEKRVSVGKWLGWGIIVLLFGLFGYFAYQGIQEGNWDELTRLVGELFLWGGGLAALGCLLARGHPLSIVTAFAVAPFTILHPGLAAGWFSGLVEAWVREPRVLDFRNLSRLTSMRAFFGNRVVRVLFVAALTNLGAMVGAGIVLGKNLGQIFGGARLLVDRLRDGVALLAQGEPRAWLVLVVGIALLALLLRKRRHK